MAKIEFRIYHSCNPTMETASIYTHPLQAYGLKIYKSHGTPEIPQDLPPWISFMPNDIWTAGGDLPCQIISKQDINCLYIIADRSYACVELKKSSMSYYELAKEPFHS